MFSECCNTGNRLTKFVTPQVTIATNSACDQLWLHNDIHNQGECLHRILVHLKVILLWPYGAIRHQSSCGYWHRCLISTKPFSEPIVTLNLASVRKFCEIVRKFPFDKFTKTVGCKVVTMQRITDIYLKFIWEVVVCFQLVAGTSMNKIFNLHGTLQHYKTP